VELVRVRVRCVFRCKGAISSPICSGRVEREWDIVSAEWRRAWGDFFFLLLLRWGMGVDAGVCLDRWVRVMSSVAMFTKVKLRFLTGVPVSSVVSETFES